MIDRTAIFNHGSARRPPPRRIWSYAGEGTWRLVAHPIPGLLSVSEAEVEDQAEAAGWHLMGSLGEKYSTFSLDLFYSDVESYLAIIWVLDRGLEVVLPGVPSLWRLLAEAGPLLAEGRASMDD